ncbi:hypothetical protein HY991_01880 [Candidatus Micrarchaeota archaeon]|nr:hypothetical protein [Candidatus Micrarchaeota archaeon]
MARNMGIARELEAKNVRRELKELLKRFGGRAHVIVHPFAFRVITRGEYVEALKSFLCREGNNPVILFEEHHRVKPTIKRLKDWGVKKPIFVVPTQVGSATPINEGILNTMRKAGLKKALVGGRLYFRRDTRAHEGEAGEITMILNLYESMLEKRNIQRKIRQLEGMKTERNAERIERLKALVKKDFLRGYAGCVGEVYHLLISKGITVSLNPKLAIPLNERELRTLEAIVERRKKGNAK